MCLDIASNLQRWCKVSSQVSLQDGVMSNGNLLAEEPVFYLPVTEGLDVAEGDLCAVGGVGSHRVPVPHHGN